jgi:two-component system, chemotaxis family, chemotaxis protein CheY
MSDKQDSRNPLRLLAVDGDSLHRMIICRIAAKAGFVPAGAASAAEAVKHAQKAAFDCVTIDLSVGRHGGVGGGLEFLNYLWMSGCKAPIIVIGGCDDEQFRQATAVAASLNLKIWKSMPKPANFDLLRGWLDELKVEGEAAAIAAA